MAHYAFVSDKDVVTKVISGKDELDFPAGATVGEGFEYWEEYYTKLQNFRVYRTSYNAYGGVHRVDGEPSEDQSQAFRFNYAGIGFTYDEARDAFIPPTPYPSWVLDEATCLWEAPVAYPDDGKMYAWDETITDWVEVQDETP